MAVSWRLVALKYLKYGYKVDTYSSGICGEKKCKKEGLKVAGGRFDATVSPEVSCSSLSFYIKVVLRQMRLLKTAKSSAVSVGKIDWRRAMTLMLPKDFSILHEHQAFNQHPCLHLKTSAVQCAPKPEGTKIQTASERFRKIKDRRSLPLSRYGVAEGFMYKKL